MTRSRPYTPPRIGFIGGGQLARMMIIAAKRLGAYCTVLDPENACPAAQLSDRHILAGYDDEQGLAQLAKHSDVITYDLENIAVEPLFKLAQQGHVLQPSVDLLSIVQDKLHQKDHLKAHHLPSADHLGIERPDADSFAQFGYPLVQKARRGGYDGRGVCVMRSKDDFAKHLPVPSLIERFIPAKLELAVMVARRKGGQSSSYPVVEMRVNTDHNVLDQLIAPARISAALAKEAQQIAAAAIESLQGVGTFGVELFLTQDDKLLINEIAPRTHNSGHHTIEACYTDQFEQHIRAISDLPLGNPQQHHAAVMINLLGEPGYSGAVRCTGLDEALALPGVSLHLYGKASTRAYRKMGHITVLGETVEAAIETAQSVKHLVKVIGETKL